MSGSATPSALGMMPTTRLVLVCRFDPAVCAQVSTRACTDRSRVLGVVERAKGNEFWKDAYHVEPAGLSVSKGGEKWAVCLALAYQFELNGIES